MANPTQKQIEDRQQQIRKKRIATLVGCYELLRQQYPETIEYTRLAPNLVSETVEKYLADRERFVARNSIKGRIQRHKIAGLMTAAIAKTRPIFLLEDGSEPYSLSYENEFFAVVHGLSLCSEGYSEAAITKMRNSKYFLIWFQDFINLVQRHPDSADGFIQIYETLCLSFFPNVFDEKK